MSLSARSSDTSTYSPSCEAGLQFVVSNSVDKPNAEVRKLIRSHCMLKKNKGKTRRPSKCETNSSANKSSPEEDLSESSTSPASSSDSVIPPKVGSDLLTIRYADAVDSYKVEVVFRCKSISLPHLSKHIRNYLSCEVLTFSTSHQSLLLPKRRCSLWMLAWFLRKGRKHG